MKNLFHGKTAKNLVGGAATLVILSLIIATTFIFVSPAFAKKLNAANQGPSGSVGPGFNKDSACQTNNDSLNGNSSPFTLNAGNAPSCDRVDWVFPAEVTASRNCTFTLDGNFDDGLTIDFYHFRSGAPSDHGNPNPVTSASTPGTLSVQGSRIGLAHLNTADESLAGKTVNLGNISYSCSGRQDSVQGPFGSFSQFRGSFSRSVPPALTKNPNCPAYTDSLTTNGSSNSWTLRVDGNPTCDFVNWTFPANIANRSCTFRADGNFDDGLTIEFFSSVSSNHSFDSSVAVDKQTVSNGRFSATDSNVAQAFLDTGSVQVGSTNLGNIKYTCQ